jgi:excisionase family DNA binding protein
MNVYTTKAIADKLGISRQTIRQNIRDKKLHATKVGRHYRISREAIEAYTGIVGIMGNPHKYAFKAVAECFQRAQEAIR